MAELVKKEVKYLNKDFGQFRSNLISFAKNYFPNTYNDFNESSPGMMFIEMSAYVGDVLSFYADTQLREGFLAEARERSNLYNLANSLSYKAKTNTPAYVKLDIFQLLPAVGSGANTSPDWRYALTVQPNALLSSTSTVKFRTLDYVDFSFSSSFDPTEVTVYEIDNTGQVTYYLLKKQVNAVSGEIKTSTFTFGNAKIYDKITLPENNVLEIIDIVDSDGNTWYEVPYLAQDTVPLSIQNIPFNDPTLSANRSSAPFILKYKKTAKRFVTRLRGDNRTEIQFGAGVSSEADEDLIPNPTAVGFGLPYFKRTADLSIDPSNFLYTQTYGQAPNNTTLTVRYTIGGGVSDNVGINTISTINSITYNSFNASLDSAVITFVKNSVAVNNPEPARGGQALRDLESIRQDAIANFAAQNRAVTREDYIVRCYAMPAKFGSIAKAFIIQDDQMSTDGDRIPNPLALNLYALGYDSNKNFTPLSNAVNENLRNYLSQYRMLTDAINIKTPYIINIGIEFEIIARPGFNGNEVVLRCIESLKRSFDNDKMGINMPIIVNQFISELDRIEGVQTVSSFKITNLYDTILGYSGNLYDIDGATKNGVIYPSLDPSIFEVKYPNSDIKGRIVTY